MYRKYDAGSYPNSQKRKSEINRKAPITLMVKHVSNILLFHILHRDLLGLSSHILLLFVLSA